MVISPDGPWKQPLTICYLLIHTQTQVVVSFLLVINPVAWGTPRALHVEPLGRELAFQWPFSPCDVAFSWDPLSLLEVNKLRV